MTFDKGKASVAPHGWAPRNARDASRLGLHLLAAGVVLHAALLVSLGPATDNAWVQAVVVLAQLLTIAAVRLWSDRLPAGIWAALVLVVTPLIALVSPFYPRATVLAVPLLFLLVVFASRSLSAPVARAVTIEALVVTTWDALRSHDGLPVAIVYIVFVGGVVVLVHQALVRGADAQELLVAALQKEASTDALTGLLTRRAFDAALASALQTGAMPVSLLIIDLDHFKRVNDEHGHPAGDSALRHVAELVAANVRRGEGSAGRLGGDELGVMFEHCTEGAALQRAHDLVSHVGARPLLLDVGGPLPLSISVGVGTAIHRMEPTEIYHAADAALYNAKRAGRNRASADSAGDRRVEKRPV